MTDKASICKDSCIDRIYKTCKNAWVIEIKICIFEEIKVFAKFKIYSLIQWVNRWSEDTFNTRNLHPVNSKLHIDIYRLDMGNILETEQYSIGIKKTGCFKCFM